MISGLRDLRIASWPPRRFITAAVAMIVRGQRALTARPCSRNSSAIPSTHMLMAYLAIVYAACGANHRLSRFKGGEIFRICGLAAFSRGGRQACEQTKAPRALT